MRSVCTGCQRPSPCNDPKASVVLNAAETDHIHEAWCVDLNKATHDSESLCLSVEVANDVAGIEIPEEFKVHDEPSLRRCYHSDAREQFVRITPQCPVTRRTRCALATDLRVTISWYLQLGDVVPEVRIPLSLRVRLCNLLKD
jgi:hypothetical protein